MGAGTVGNEWIECDQCEGFWRASEGRFCPRCRTKHRDGGDDD